MERRSRLSLCSRMSLWMSLYVLALSGSPKDALTALGRLLQLYFRLFNSSEAAVPAVTALTAAHSCSKNFYIN